MSIRLRQVCDLVSVVLLACVLAIPALAEQHSQLQRLQHDGMPPMVGKGALGKITAVSDSSITVEARNGTDATFTVSSATKVTLNGAASAIADVKTGEFAAVTSSDGKAATAIDAHTMGSMPPPPPPTGKGAVGEISAISDTSITVTPRGGTTATFTIATTTKIMLDGKASVAADLKAGEYAGVASTDGKSATAIYASTRPPFGPPPPPSVGKGAVGKITAISDTSITVMTRTGDSVTFTLSSSTKVSLDGDASESADLEVDQFAAVVSTDGKAATEVLARTMPPGHGGPGR